MTLTAKQRAHAKRRVQADPASIYKVLNRLQPFNAAELLKLELPLRLSFEALRTGTGTESDWSDIAAAINVVVMRSRDIGWQCEQPAGEASDALVRMYQRAQTTGRWAFDGPGLQAVEIGIELHEQLCRLSTPLQMMDAMRRVLAVRAAQGVGA